MLARDLFITMIAGIINNLLFNNSVYKQDNDDILIRIINLVKEAIQTNKLTNDSKVRNSLIEIIKNAKMLRYICKNKIQSKSDSNIESFEKINNLLIEMLKEDKAARENCENYLHELVKRLNIKGEDDLINKTTNLINKIVTNTQIIIAKFDIYMK